MHSAFELDSRLAADTLELGRTPLSRVLLMNDVRYPWILLVPERAGLRELFELALPDARRLQDESRLLGRLMVDTAPGAKLNVGSLGNIVSQLHLHHVLRVPGDPAWPGPVWGHGARIPHATDARDAAVTRWTALLAPLLDA